MLCVRIDGQEVETTPASLATWVLDGKADRHSPARPPDGLAPQPLEQALGTPHAEALAGELQRRLRRMCSLDSEAVDVQELCTRVEGLCQWRWANPPSAARFFWTAAWLNELLDRPKSAIDFYDAFLLMPCPEEHLRLLARNNRGVLRIRLGRLDGVADLASAALGCPLAVPRSPSPVLHSGPTGNCQPATVTAGLPAACFNLLNLIHVALGAADLLQVVDEELMDIFARQPQDVCAGWLEGGEGASGVSPILRDPTCRRLHAVTVRLATQARVLLATSSPRADRASSVFQHLSLWDEGSSSVDSSALPVPSLLPTVNCQPRTDNRHFGYAEAAGLLASDDIPSLLTRAQDPLARVEQAAQEELALLESHLAAGRYELAKARLQVQRQILSSLPGRGGPAVLLARVEAQIERVAHLEAQDQQCRLQQACAGFVAEVERFGTLSDLGQARRMLEDLRGRWQQLRAQESPRPGTEVLALLEELADRCGKHLRELERAEIEKKIGASLQCVRENWPSEEASPVPDVVYGALAQCRLQDPEGRVEDWGALQKRLDAHQGRYHVHQARETLLSNPDSGEQVQNHLVQALTCDPETWGAVAPWFGLGGEEDFGFRIADRGLNKPLAANPQSTIRHPKLTMAQAARLLERALQRLGGDTEKCRRLWQCVERTLLPALGGGDIEALTQARILAEGVLDHWPAGRPETPGRTDPRHPVNRFLDACEKAHSLIEAQRLLDARPPQWDRARERFTALLRSGLDTGAQLRRAATGLYLARFHEKDAPPVQRQVLVDLEEWVRTVPPERVPQMREQEVVEEMERIRESVGEVGFVMCDS